MAKRGKRNKAKARAKNAAKLERLGVLDQDHSDKGKAPPWTPKERLPLRVFTMGNCTIWGGDVWTRTDRKWAAIICLGEHREPFKNGPVFETYNGADIVLPAASALASKAVGIPEIYMDWRDYEAPPAGVDAAFWIALLGDLKGVTGDVLVHCAGGHGRTGTALAAMLHLAPRAGLKQVVPVGECVVTWVRDHSSDRAIESGDQTDYLVALGATVGRKVRDEMDYSSDWWKSYDQDRGSTDTSGVGYGYDAAKWSKSGDEYCDMCGVQLTGMTIRTVLGVYCSDNCSDHDEIMHTDRARKIAGRSADPTCDCHNGNGVSCAKCDPDYQTTGDGYDRMDRAGGEL